MKKHSRSVATGATIAALYVGLTHLSNMAGLASGAIQFRLSEILTFLPLFTPAAIPGLTIGCLLSNLTTGCIPWDIAGGTAATLLGALGTRALKDHRLLGEIPPILANILIVPLVLRYAYGFEGTLPYFMLTVGIGEFVCCGILGTSFMLSVSRNKTLLWLFENMDK